VTRSGGSDAMAAQLTPQQLVETALAASRTDGCVVVVTSQTTANIRWANNTVTTSGATSEWSWFVVAIAGRAAGTAASTSTDPADIENVLRAAEQAARDAGPAEDAMELVGGHASDAFEMVAAESDFGVYDRLIPSLAVAFGAARAEEQILYGFARHEQATTYLGTSTGIRERWVQPTGTLEMNAKSADLTRSAWAGLSTDDFTDVDPAAVGASLAERLNWASRTVALPAGRYDTVLPPSSVADLMIYLAWTASGRAAHEGRSPFSAPGGGTRIGERLGALPLSLFSDPAAYPIQAAPFVAAASSSDETSVFDNGAPIGRTTLLDRGILSGLIHTRSSAARFGEPFAPVADNLVLAGGDEQRSVADLVAGVERGLLLTSLWYIRSVDPMTLLLTGLTRDGVYLVEGGEIVGAVNNFRFNMSPLDVLRQGVAASRVERSLSREWADWFTRTLTPGLRVADFNMSSVSQAQ
jgi:predicted Zn-dependent protease